jgi:hypothetical protein
MTAGRRIRPGMDCRSCGSRSGNIAVICWPAVPVLVVNLMDWGGGAPEVRSKEARDRNQRQCAGRQCPSIGLVLIRELRFGKKSGILSASPTRFRARANQARGGSLRMGAAGSERRGVFRPTVRLRAEEERAALILR